jgi:hypothetical protein
MNLINGKITDNTTAWQIKSDLYPLIINTLSKPPLDTEIVISACDEFVTGLTYEAYADLFAELDLSKEIAEAYIQRGKNEFCREALTERLSRELGDDRTHIRPLGVLLHIAAGNADGLPVFSILEGLLTGNINLLKLPSAIDKITIPLLLKLFEIAPSLTEYVYVFDFSSKDISKTESLIGYADGVIVWGGDSAVTALRRIVPPNVKLIEWGHKVSFAYLSGEATEDELNLLAGHIVKTNGLLCSSCQGIYIDTQDETSIEKFSERFLPCLTEYASKKRYSVGITARRTLFLQNEIFNGKKVLKGENCGIVIDNDNALDSGSGYAAIWVKALPSKDILSVLKPYRGRLQTIGLICPPKRRNELSNLFIKSGATAVTHSDMTPITTIHDGEYALRRYVKVCIVT